MPRGRLTALLAVGLAVAATAVSCGTGATVGTGGKAQGNELARGRELFQDVPRDNMRCGFCHTLRSAETSGTFAVNLDDEFSLDRSLGHKDSTIRQVVLDYIRNPPCFEPNNPNRCMPKGLYSGDDAVAVADFIASCAGRSRTPICRPVGGGLRGEAARGEYLYANSGCPSCHWSAENKPVGPSLNGLAGSRVELANGKTVIADDAYLITSILAPDAQIVKGYPSGFMSARLKPGEISAAQVKAIVAYIKTLK